MGRVDADQAEVAAVGQVPHRDEEDLDPAEQPHGEQLLGAGWQLAPRGQLSGRPVQPGRQLSPLLAVSFLHGHINFDDLKKPQI